MLQGLRREKVPSFDAGCQRIKALNFSELQDKSAVKPLVSRITPYIKVATQYALVRRAADLDGKLLASLPAHFIMKGTHGAGMTVQVKDGAATCAKDNSRYCPVGVSGVAGLSFLRDTCTHWLGVDFGRIHGERSYSSIRPGCIFEELLPSIVDFKVYAFHGVPHWALLQLDKIHRDISPQTPFSGRRYGFTEEGGLRPLMTTSAYKPMTASRCGRIQSSTQQWCAADVFEAEPVPIPRQAIRHMYLATRRLYEVLLASRGATMVRVDFLLVNGTQPAFGELTFTNANCQAKLIPHLSDVLHGRVGAPARSALTPSCIQRALRFVACNRESPFLLRTAHGSNNDSGAVATRTASGGTVTSSMGLGNGSSPFLRACNPIPGKMRLRPRSAVHAWLALAERPSLRRLIKKITS